MLPLLSLLIVVVIQTDISNREEQDDKRRELLGVLRRALHVASSLVAGKGGALLRRATHVRPRLGTC